MRFSKAHRSGDDCCWRKLITHRFQGEGSPTPWETERGDTWKSTVVGQGAAEREEPPARASIPVSLGEDRQGRTAGLGLASLKDVSSSEAKELWPFA